MSDGSILAAEEESALEEAAECFSKRDCSRGSHRVRPKGMNIFDWLSSGRNSEAFKESRKAMELLEDGHQPQAAALR